MVDAKYLIRQFCSRCGILMGYSLLAQRMRNAHIGHDLRAGAGSMPHPPCLIGWKASHFTFVAWSSLWSRMSSSRKRSFGAIFDRLSLGTIINRGNPFPIQGSDSGGQWCHWKNAWFWPIERTGLRPIHRPGHVERRVLKSHAVSSSCRRFLSLIKHHVQHMSRAGHSQGEVEHFSAFEQW